MTIDKIAHYIGKEQVEFIGNLNRLQLEKMKREIIHDMNSVKLDSSTLFKRTIELEFIKSRLRN